MRRPNPFLVVTVLFWGFNFVSLKLIPHAVVLPAALLFFRLFATWGALALLVRLRGGSLRAPREHRPRILLSGGLTMGAYMLLFLEGAARTAPAEAAIVLATMPVVTWLMSVAAGEDRFSLLRLAGSLVAFAGVGLVVLGGRSSGGGGEVGGHLLGDAVVFAGGLFWCLGIVVARPVLRTVEPLRYYALSMPGAAPLVVLYGLLPALHTRWADLGALGWANVAQLVLGSGVLATACYYRGIADLGAAGATAYQFFVPPVAAAFAWIVLGQAMHPLQALGIAVVVLGLMAPNLLARVRGGVPAPQPAS